MTCALRQPVQHPIKIGSERRGGKTQMREEKSGEEGSERGMENDAKAIMDIRQATTVHRPEASSDSSTEQESRTTSKSTRNSLVCTKDRDQFLSHTDREGAAEVAKKQEVKITYITR